MSAWLLIAVVALVLWAFWIALNWTFDLIEWAHERLRERELLDERLRRLDAYVTSSRFALTRDDVIYDWETGRDRYALEQAAADASREDATPTRGTGS